MKLSLSSEDGGQCVVLAEGELKQNRNEVSDPLRSLVGSLRARTVVLNLRRITSYDATGLTWLMNTHAAIAQARGELILLALPATIRRALALMGCSNRIRAVESLSAARETVAVEAA